MEIMFIILSSPIFPSYMTLRLTSRADTAPCELYDVKSSTILCWITLPYEKFKVEEQSSNIV